ncbi:hypothetical protein ACG7TL_005969 [Trametes sanguinea]
MPHVLGHLQPTLLCPFHIPHARVPMSSMSPSSSSSLSSSPASSLSSAPLATWSPALQLNTMNAASTRTPPQLHGKAPPIASLPSLAHSLSAFPNMTVVANDMVHYGTLGRTKGVSEAKVRSTAPTLQRAGLPLLHQAPSLQGLLTSALRKTKQRQDAGPGAMVSASATSGPSRTVQCPTAEDDDPILLIVPKRSKAKQSS